MRLTVYILHREAGARLCMRLPLHALNPLCYMKVLESSVVVHVGMRTNLLHRGRVWIRTCCATTVMALTEIASAHMRIATLTDGSHRATMAVELQRSALARTLASPRFPMTVPATAGLHMMIGMSVKALHLPVGAATQIHHPAPGSAYTHALHAALCSSVTNRICGTIESRACCLVMARIA